MGITRGALYHQFGDKRGVFRSVIEEVFGEIAQVVEKEASQSTTPWDQLVQGSHAYLEVAQRDDRRRLIFVEAPAVLDGDTLTRLDRQYSCGLQEAIQAVVDTGELDPPDVEGFAMMINGALDQLAAWTAQSESSERLTKAKLMVERLLALHRTPSI